MAYLFADGFDTLSVIGDMSQRWDTATTVGTALVAAASTAFAVGGAIAVAAGSYSYIKSWGSNDATIYLNVRRKQTAGSSSAQYHGFTFSDGVNAQCSVRWNEDGSIAAYGGGLTGTLLGSATAAGVAVSGQWDSWQVKIVIHNTTGTVEVRKNGSASPVLNLSSVNTRAGSANVYVNKITMGGSVSGSSTYFDDIFLFSGSGAAPNTWAGDLRCLTDAPTGTAQTQWSKSPTTTSTGQTNAATATAGTAANIITYVPFVAPYSGTISAINISVGTVSSGSVNCALYDGTTLVPVNLMAQSTGVSPASGAGVLAFTLSSPQTVVKGSTYWMAVWQSVAQGSLGLNGTSAISRATQTLTYTGTFPATTTSPVLATSNCVYCTATYATIVSHSVVADTTQDGDNSYVYSATVGQEDLYTSATLSSQGATPVSIVGVIPFAVLKKSDSGSRTVSVRAVSGASNTAAATNAAPGLSYSFLGGFLATDPNTSAAWTTAAVDAMQVGVKVDA